MNGFLNSSGNLSEVFLPEIIHYIYKENIFCSLIIKTDTSQKEIFIENGKIVFASSDNLKDNLGTFLFSRDIISEDIYKETGSKKKKNGKRLGKILVEKGVFNYDQLWYWVEEHLKWLSQSIFFENKGEYHIRKEYKKSDENIILDYHILQFLVDGIRNNKDYVTIKEKTSHFKNMFFFKKEIMEMIELKSYEKHILDLLKKFTDVETILKMSELSENDTLKILYMFKLLQVISIDKNEIEKKSGSSDQEQISAKTFHSYEEALKHYNLKYEMIYKVLSKEIGPISLSILSRSIEDIKDNLPSYLKNAELEKDGKLKDNSVLKKVWYYDFETTITNFMRGLEEILYAEIYAVKKNLGIEFEHQILKWIKGIKS
ncbi:MAG: DUF4388 domain-containing protein [Acidobacteriota bacterium]